MAEAPAVTGSSQESSQSNSEAGSVAVDPTSEAGTADASDDAVTADTSAEAAAPAKVKKTPVEKVLDGPALSDIMNADSRSMVFVLDQKYTAVGENGMTARFTFNPTSEAFINSVFVEAELEGLIFEFKPAEPMLISGKNEDGLEAFIFAGKVPTLIDEFGKKWSETVAKGATFVIEVTMERNGTTVKEISLAMYRANS
jgi:hypothetical protein